MSQLYLDLIISDKVKAIIEKTCQFLLENGSEHEEYLLKSKSAHDENFGFLFQENPYHVYYKTYLEWLKTPESNTKKFDFYEIINKKKKPAQMRMDLETPKIENIANLPYIAKSNPNQMLMIPNNNMNMYANANNNLVNTNNFANNNPGLNNNNVPSILIPSQNIYNSNNSKNNVPSSTIPSQNVYNSNNGNQPIKKKNRWSDSAVVQNENNNRSDNNNRPIYTQGQGYPQPQQQPLMTNTQQQPLMSNMSLNKNYAACYNQQFANNPIVMPNILNQMSTINNNNYMNNPLLKNMMIQNTNMQATNNLIKNEVGNYMIANSQITSANAQNKNETANTQYANYSLYSKQQQIINQIKAYTSVDEIPIGIMADMIKQQQINGNRGNNLNLNLMQQQKFTPLDINTIPPVSYYDRFSETSDVIKAKVDQFYKFMDEEREYERKLRRKREKEKEKEKNSYDAKNQKEKFEAFKRRDIQREIEDLYSDRNDDGNLDNMNMESRMRNDGQMYGSGFHNTEERQGLGQVPTEADIYSKFRKQRSYQYHVSAEERSLTKDQPELCYVCQMPGHIARDCKFGLT